MKIGARLESFGLPLRQAVAEARRIGVGGVQLDAVGDLSPKALSHSARREMRHLFRSHDLELTALGCPTRHGLDVAVGLQDRMDQIKQVLDLSFELGPRRVLIQAGKIPNDPGDSPMAEAALALGQHGDRVGAVVCFETGLESGAELAAFLARFDTGGLAVNFDPANLFMSGIDPFDSALALRERIVHVHAKDARRSGANRQIQEVPLGHGDLDWMRMFSVLAEIDYRGWVVIERETQPRREDVAAGAAFLRRLIP